MRCAISVISLAVLTSVIPAQGTWELLHPTRATSQAGATLTVQKDGAIIVGGKNPATDTFVVDAPTALTDVTGFRIEVLPHDGLSAKGPGRASNGNFVLNELVLSAASKLSPGRQKRVPIGSIDATFSQVGYGAAAMIDGNVKTGWAVSPRFGQAQVVQLAPVRIVKHRAGTVVRFKMTFAYGSQHTIGHFRVYVTGAPGPHAAPGSGPGVWAKTQRRINLAIDRGVEWMLARQHLDGSFRDFAAGGYPSGGTALAIYTLIKSGVDREHGAVQRGVRFLKTRPPVRTYSTACQVLAFSALDRTEHREWLERLVRQLVETQRGDGGWGYPHGAVDLSNTQYAALALHMAAKRGVKIPRRVWKKLAERVLDHLVEAGTGAYSPAGFAYRPKGKASGSMTAAGVGTLAICDQHMKPRKNQVTVVIKRGIVWLGRYFSTSSNIQGSPRWLLYYLYGLERAGGLTNVDLFGPHDWYKKGAKWLVDNQAKGGSWKTAQGEYDVNTCFALLFLAKATGSVTGGQASGARLFGYEDATKDVSLRINGDRPLAMFIPRFGDKALAKFGWPGDEKKGLRVLKVEYLAAPAKDMKGAEVIETVGWDAKEPSGRNPFAARHTFAHPGARWIRVRVTVALHALDAEEAGKTQQLLSDPVRVTTWDVVGEYLAYGDAASHNLLITRSTSAATASSEYGGIWRAVRAFDGLQSVGWLTKDNDAEPWIRIDLDRPVRFDTLVLSHTRSASKRKSRIRKVKVTINRRNVLGVIDMVMDDRRKTVWPLPKPKNVRSIRLDVLETQVQGLKGVGFAEVELQLRAGKR